MPTTLITTVTSKDPKRKGTKYQIRRGSDRQIYCTCPGWTYYGRCKHLEAYKTQQDELTESYS